MSRNPEIDAAIQRLNRLSDGLESLIHRRTRALDAAAGGTGSGNPGSGSRRPDHRAAERDLMMGPPKAESLDELKQSMDEFFNSGRRSTVVDVAYRQRMHAALDKLMGGLGKRRITGGQRASNGQEAKGLGQRARAADSAETADQIMRRRRREMRGLNS